MNDSETIIRLLSKYLSVDSAMDLRSSIINGSGDLDYHPSGISVFKFDQGDLQKGSMCKA